MSHKNGTLPEVVFNDLSAQLSSLNLLLPRLSAGEAAPSHTAAVSARQLMQARSHTALSCRFTARLASAAVEDEPAVSTPAGTVLASRELLELCLSYLGCSDLCSSGSVSTEWYLASRMQTLWAAQLQLSGRLPAGLDAIPREDEWTLFETAARIERHGCRPVESAVPPDRGRIDHFVDDLAAYCHDEGPGPVASAAGLELVPANVAANLVGAPAVAAGSAAAQLAAARLLSSCRHVTRGRVSIRALSPHASRTLLALLRAGREIPLASSVPANNRPATCQLPRQRHANWHAPQLLLPCRRTCTRCCRSSGARRRSRRWSTFYIDTLS